LTNRVADLEKTRESRNIAIATLPSTSNSSGPKGREAALAALKQQLADVIAKVNSLEKDQSEPDLDVKPKTKGTKRKLVPETVTVKNVSRKRAEKPEPVADIAAPTTRVSKRLRKAK
jgi:hypothetical protein